MKASRIWIWERYKRCQLYCFKCSVVIVISMWKNYYCKILSKCPSLLSAVEEENRTKFIGRGLPWLQTTIQDGDRIASRGNAHLCSFWNASLNMHALIIFTEPERILVCYDKGAILSSKVPTTYFNSEWNAAPSVRHYSNHAHIKTPGTTAAAQSSLKTWVGGGRGLAHSLAHIQNILKKERRHSLEIAW